MTWMVDTSWSLSLATWDQQDEPEWSGHSGEAEPGGGWLGPPAQTSTSQGHSRRCSHSVPSLPAAETYAEPACGTPAWGRPATSGSFHPGRASGSSSQGWKSPLSLPFLTRKPQSAPLPGDLLKSWSKGLGPTQLSIWPGTQGGSCWTI